VRRSSDVDHLTCHFPKGSTAASAARRAGFLRSPARVTLTALPLRGSMTPDPIAHASWALTLGDLEVF